MYVHIFVAEIKSFRKAFNELASTQFSDYVAVDSLVTRWFARVFHNARGDILKEIMKITPMKGKQFIFKRHQHVYHHVCYAASAYF